MSFQAAPQYIQRTRDEVRQEIETVMGIAAAEAEEMLQKLETAFRSGYLRVPLDIAVFRARNGHLVIARGE